jgi:transketolase
MDLIRRARGDEKHDESSYSTLEVIDVLYDVMRFDAGRPDWEGRDRFILSKGHGPLAFYAVLVEHGFFEADEMDRFLTWDGILGGHPDRNRVPGVEASTGSLGHGLPMAVGVAYALRAKGADEQRVFVLTGDAELNEGSNWEAILHAGARRLTNLTLIVVDNRSSSVEMGAIAAKLASFGWDAVTVNGHDQDALRAAYERRGDAPTAVVAVV